MSTKAESTTMMLKVNRSLILRARGTIEGFLTRKALVEGRPVKKLFRKNSQKSKINVIFSFRSQKKL